MTLLTDLDAERMLIASLLESPATLTRVLAEERLMPEHFWYETHGTAFSALVAIADRGEHVDPLALRAELERAGIGQDDPTILRVLTEPPDLAGVFSYARRVKDLHHRRQIKLAAEILSDAADRGDPDRLAEAEALLTTPAEAEISTWSGKDLAERYYERLDEPAPETFRWPFLELDNWTGGGLRRKQIVLIGGWTSMGKSILYDQILEMCAKQGLNCHSYINEMSEHERMDRTVARLSGVPFSRVHSRRFKDDEKKRVYESLTSIKVGLTECAGWTAEEIARHIRWNHWDVAGVDIVHEIAHREERDLAEIAQILRAAAKQTGCALIACVHLNDNRVTSPQRPIPVLRDVRGSGMLVRGADIVLMIHRDDDADGVPTADGVLLASKIRNGQPSLMGVSFDAQRMRFLPRAVT